MKEKARTLQTLIFRDFLETGKLPVRSKLPTVMDLAQRYGASGPSIGKAIALLEAEGWVNTRRGSGIYVAALPNEVKAKAQKSQIHIGFVVPSLAHPVLHRIFEGIDYIGREKNCFFEVANSGGCLAEEMRQIRLMQERGVQGVILYPWGHRSEGDEYLAKEFRDLPMVVVDLYEASMKRSHVIFDNYSAGLEITRHLLSQGRKNIAFINYEAKISLRSSADRFEGYKRALKDAGIPYNPELVKSVSHEVPAAARGHLEIFDQLLKQRVTPDAIIEHDDEFARVGISYLRRKGVAVPEEVLMAGFDNLQNSGWNERFPTTNADFAQMGERAAQILLEQIESPGTERTRLILPCPVLIPEASPLERLLESNTGDAVETI